MAASSARLDSLGTDDGGGAASSPTCRVSMWADAVAPPVGFDADLLPFMPGVRDARVDSGPGQVQGVSRPAVVTTPETFRALVAFLSEFLRRESAPINTQWPPQSKQPDWCREHWRHLWTEDGCMTVAMTELILLANALHCQPAVASLALEIGDMIKQHPEDMDEIRRRFRCDPHYTPTTRTM